MIVYDALIIGAGPAGSFCAYKLSKLGLNVLLVESQKEIKRKVCGEYLSPMGVDILRTEGLEKELINPFLPILGMNITPFKGESLRTFFPKKSGLALNRKSFDENFLGLAEKAGTTVKLGSRVKSIVRSSLSWVVKVGEEGNEVTFRTRLLIGADGRNSFTAKSLGLKSSVDTSRLALHCHIEVSKTNERLGEMHLFDDGSYIGIDPTGDNEINIALCCKSSSLKKTTARDLLNSYIQKSKVISEKYGLVPENIKVNTVTPITNKMSGFTSQNAALIGDAAGFLDPLTGEGMFNGLWMAKCLAEEISISNNITIFDYQNAINRYSKRKKSFFRQKIYLNLFFQFIIKRPLLVGVLASYLKKKQARANIFVGIIGNVYKPIEGIFKILNS